MENVTNTSKSTISKIKETISWITLIIMTCAFLFVGYKAWTGQIPFVFGHGLGITLSGSMEPYMMTNSVTINREITDPSQVEVGDVVAYKVQTTGGEISLVTHRVIAIDGDVYFFKGDNNRVEDGYGVPSANLVSEIKHVFNQDIVIEAVSIGRWLITQWNTDMTGKAICICAAIALVSIYQLVCMILRLLIKWIKGLFTKAMPNKTELPLLHSESTQLDTGSESTTEEPSIVNETTTQATP